MYIFRDSNDNSVTIRINKLIRGYENELNTNKELSYKGMRETWEKQLKESLKHIIDYSGFIEIKKPEIVNLNEDM